MKKEEKQKQNNEKKAVQEGNATKLRCQIGIFLNAFFSPPK